jgi:hypothetical protein
MKKLLYSTLLLLMAAFGCYTESEVRRGKLPHVEVSLGKSISLIEARKWPTHSDGRLFEAMLIQEPCDLVIHLPSGIKLNFEVRNADLHQENSVVSDVKVRMPIEPLDYGEAITRLDDMYSRLAKARDPQFSKKIESWRENPPTPGWPQSNMTRVNFENNVELELGIETVYYKGADKWAYFLTFYPSN